jgi:hypothetical protein
MLKDINEIVGSLNKDLLIKQNLYEVTIYDTYNTISGALNTSIIDIMLNCQAITIPGYNIGFSNDKRYGIGTIINYPNAKDWTDLTMSFYESESGKERNYFVEWINSIYDKETKRFNFFKDYIKNIEIKQYDRTGKIRYRAKLIDCYPSTVGGLDRSYQNSSVPIFNVSFQFTEFEEEFL